MHRLSTKLAAMGGALSIVLAISGFVPGAEAKPATRAAHTVTHNNATHTNLRQTHANFSHPRTTAHVGSSTRTGGTHGTGTQATNLRKTRSNFATKTGGIHGTANTSTGVSKVVRQNGQGGSGGGTANTGTSRARRRRTRATRTPSLATPTLPTRTDPISGNLYPPPALPTRARRTPATRKLDLRIRARRESGQLLASSRTAPASR